MKHLWLGLMTCALSFAQTKLTPDQMRAAPAATWRVIAVAPDGSFKTLELGPGISIVNDQLVAAVTYIPQSQRLSLVNGGYVLPSWAAEIKRNGQEMEAGEDYTVTGNILTPKVPWAVTDFIVAKGYVPLLPVVALKP